MKGSPCCAGLMQSCLHTYRTKTNLTQHIIQPWGGIRQVWVGGGINQLWGGPSAKYGGPSVKYGGVISQVWGAISQVWGGHQPTMGGSSAKYGGVSIFPPVCTGSQNPQNYFSNTYVLPSVNRMAGPINSQKALPHVTRLEPSKCTPLWLFTLLVDISLRSTE